MAPVTVTDDTFQAEVVGSSLPVLVDFWAAWCAPCRAVAPILEELSVELAGKLKIAKVDVDANPRLSAALRIQSIPTLMIWRGGKPVHAAQGALPKPQLKALIERFLPELGPPTIAPKALAERLSRGEPIQLLDLRREQDFARSHLLGAEVIAEADVAARVEASPGQLLVLVCRTGEQSRRVAEQVGRADRQVVALEKGLLEWEGARLPTYSTREEQELRAAQDN